MADRLASRILLRVRPIFASGFYRLLADAHLVGDSVIHDTDPSPTRCEGTWYQVDSAGFFEAAVSPYDAVALYVGGA